MKIFSKTLEEEIEIGTVDSSAGMLLSHEDLMNVIIEHMPRFRYQLIHEHVSENHSVYRCVIDDTETGKHVESIGESVPETLSTEISKNYPTLMAAKRAFDEAAITILRLPGKFYSNEQILGQASALETASDKESIEELPVNVGIKETIEEAEGMPDETPVVEQKPVETSSDTGHDVKTDEVDLNHIEDFTLAFSVSKGKSFLEVYNDKSRWNSIKGWLKKNPKMKYNDDLRSRQLAYVLAVIAKEDEMEENKIA